MTLLNNPIHSRIAFIGMNKLCFFEEFLECHESLKSLMVVFLFHFFNRPFSKLVNSSTHYFWSIHGGTSE